jgi:molybdate transport system substrate-binding protein
VPLAGNVLAAIGVKEIAQSVRRADQLLRPEVVRVALAEPSCPLGRYAEAYLKRRGLMGTLRRRALYVDNARSVLAAVQAGRAEAGIVYGTDAAAGGCRLLFRARGPSAPIRYLGTILRQTRHQEKAEALLAFLASPLAAERFRRCGFLPVSRGNTHPELSV